MGTSYRIHQVLVFKTHSNRDEGESFDTLAEATAYFKDLSNRLETLVSNAATPLIGAKAEAWRLQDDADPIRVTQNAYGEINKESNAAQLLNRGA